jgi:hypothetical protein
MLQAGKPELNIRGPSEHLITAFKAKKGIKFALMKQLNM